MSFHGNSFENVNMQNETNRWARKVGMVFNTRPRIKNKDTVWLERKEGSKRLREAFLRPGAHVCLDGPSGAGKTSLALTHIFTENVVYVPVQVTASMKWTDFCRMILVPDTSTSRESSVSGEIELGIDKLLPIAKLRVSLGDKLSDLNDLSLIEKTCQNWSGT